MTQLGYYSREKLAMQPAFKQSWLSENQSYAFARSASQVLPAATMSNLIAKTKTKPKPMLMVYLHQSFVTSALMTIQNPYYQHCCFRPASITPPYICIVVF